VVIDALGDLSVAAGDATRMHDYIYALVQHFAVMGVSSLLTLETDLPLVSRDANQGRLSHMTDNIVFLDIREREGIVRRTLRIAKGRGLAHDLQPRELRIDARGLSVVEAGG
jgi:circadian clock protein KaiC